jgi:hypothetical protein
VYVSDIATASNVTGGRIALEFSGVPAAAHLLNFNNVGRAVFALHACATGSGCSTLVGLRDVSGDVVPSLYFLAFVVFVKFVAGNVFIAVMWQVLSTLERSRNQLWYISTGLPKMCGPEWTVQLGFSEKRLCRLEAAVVFTSSFCFQAVVVFASLSAAILNAAYTHDISPAMFSFVEKCKLGLLCFYSLELFLHTVTRKDVYSVLFPNFWCLQAALIVGCWLEIALCWNSDRPTTGTVLFMFRTLFLIQSAHCSVFVEMRTGLRTVIRLLYLLPDFCVMLGIHCLVFAVWGRHLSSTIVSTPRNQE